MLREEKVSANVNMVIDSMAELVEEQSFNEITIEDVIERARLSRPTVYKYFSSKEDILARLGSKILDTLANNLINHTEWQGSARNKLQHLYRVLAKELRVIKPVWRALAESGAFYAEPMLKSRRYLDRFIIGIIAEGQQKGEVDKAVSALLLANNLTALQISICNEWCMGYPRRESLSKRLKLGVDLFFEGIAS